MSTTKETMNVIAQGPAEITSCAVIEAIARRAADCFVEAAEFEFENEEGIFIKDLLLRLYLKGDYWEAIGLLTLSFSLAGMDGAGELVALVGSCQAGDSAK